MVLALKKLIGKWSSRHLNNVRAEDRAPIWRLSTRDNFAAVPTTPFIPRPLSGLLVALGKELSLL